MKVLQHTSNERNLFFKPDRSDRCCGDSLLKTLCRTACIARLGQVSCPRNHRQTALRMRERETSRYFEIVVTSDPFDRGKCSIKPSNRDISLRKIIPEQKLRKTKETKAENKTNPNKDSSQVTKHTVLSCICRS